MFQRTIANLNTSLLHTHTPNNHLWITSSGLFMKISENLVPKSNQDSIVNDKVSDAGLEDDLSAEIALEIQQVATLQN